MPHRLDIHPGHGERCGIPCRAVMNLKFTIRCWLLFGALLFGAASARAHQPGESYLNLTFAEGRVTGQWDLALRDIDFAIGLDANGNGEITYEELQNKQRLIAAYALARLQLRVNGVVLAPEISKHEVAQYPDGIYAVMNFEIPDVPSPRAVDLTYRLFFDLGTQHRGLVNLTCDAQSQVAVFSPAKAEQHFDLADPNPWKQALQFATEGVWHIWLGFDHILFLLALLLPAVLLREAGQWRGVDSFRPAFMNVVKVVTAFTIAHALTLTLATLHIVRLPTRLVESAIAATVIFAALNNVRPFFHGRMWMIAFGFGLVHGFGFANALDGLGLGPGLLALALVGFNLGVEAGQLVIAGLFLPVAYFLRASWFYQQLTFRLGSVCVVLVASTWLVQRMFDLPLLPF
jgi:hypothetical protein